MSVNNPFEQQIYKPIKIDGKKFDLSKLAEKGGIKISDNMSEVQRNIFRLLDGNKKLAENGAADNIIDAEELVGLLHYISDECGSNRKLGKKEFRSLISLLGLESSGITEEELQAFFEEIFAQCETIESSEVVYNETRLSITTDTQGVVETRNGDGTYTKKVSSDDGKQSLEEFYTADDQLIKSVEINNGVTITRNFKVPNSTDESGEFKLTTVVRDDSQNNTHTVVRYDENNLPSDSYVDSDGKREEFVFVNINGAMTPVPSRTIEYGEPPLADAEQYLQNAADENSGLPEYDEQYSNTQSVKSVTTYSYANDGVVLTTIAQPSENSDGNTLVTQTMSQRGVVQEVHSVEGAEGHRIIRSDVNGQNNQSFEEVYNEADGTAIRTTYDAPVGGQRHRIASQYIKGDKVLNQVSYRNGNTCIVRGFVNNAPESDRAIAERFGVSLDVLRAINGGSIPKGVGAEILVPGELEANDKKIVNRDTKEVALEKERRYQEFVRQDQQLREIGLDNYQHKGEKYTVTIDGKAVEVTVLGTKAHRDRLLACYPDPNNKDSSLVCTLEPDGRGNYKAVDATKLYLTDYYDDNLNNPAISLVVSGKNVVKANDEILNAVSPQLKQLVTGTGRSLVVTQSGEIRVTSNQADGGTQTLLSDEYMSARIFVDRMVAAYKGRNSSFTNSMSLLSTALQIQDDAGKQGVDVGYTYGSDYIYAKVNGQIFYFDSSGKRIDNSVVERKISEKITTDIVSAAKNDEAWYNFLGTGMGTDEDKLRNAVGGIKSHSVLSLVNSQLSNKGYSQIGGYSVLESLIRDEEGSVTTQVNHYFKPLSRNAMTAVETGQLAARLTRDELNTYFRSIDDFNTYTSSSNLETIGTLITSPAARKAFDGQLKTIMPDLKLTDADRGSYYRAALRSDGLLPQNVWGGGWSEGEINLILANGIATSGGYNQDDEADLAELTYIQNQLVFNDDGNESWWQSRNTSINAGLDIASRFSKCRDALSTEAARHNENQGWSSYVNGQDPIETYLSHIAAGGVAQENVADEVDTDDLQMYIEHLYSATGSVPPEVQAKADLISYSKKEYWKIFKSTDPRYYSAMEELIKNDPNLPNSLQELYQNMIDDINNPDVVDTNMLMRRDKYNASGLTEAEWRESAVNRIKVHACISGQIHFSDEEAARLCQSLINEMNENKNIQNDIMVMDAFSSSTSSSDVGVVDGDAHQTHTYVATRGSFSDDEKEKLLLIRGILTRHPNVANLVKIENDNFRNALLAPDSWTNDNLIHIQNEFNNVAATVMRESTKPVFYDENGRKLDSDQDKDKIDEIVAKNLERVEEYRRQFASFGIDFKFNEYKGGMLTGLAEASAYSTGLGTDAGDVIREQGSAEIMFINLMRAAQGTLLDAENNPVSFDDYARIMDDQLERLRTTQDSHVSSIETWKMGFKMAPLLVTPFVVKAAPILATGFVTAGMNSTEILTARNGSTAQAWENNVLETAVTMGTMKIGFETANTFFTRGNLGYNALARLTSNTAVHKGLTLGATVGSDVGAGALGEYVMTKDVSLAGTAMNALFSVVGNTIAVRQMHTAETGVRYKAKANEVIDNGLTGHVTSIKRNDGVTFDIKFGEKVVIKDNQIFVENQSGHLTPVGDNSVIEHMHLDTKGQARWISQQNDRIKKIIGKDNPTLEELTSARQDLARLDEVSQRSLAEPLNQRITDKIAENPSEHSFKTVTDEINTVQQYPQELREKLLPKLEEALEAKLVNFKTECNSYSLDELGLIKKHFSNLKVETQTAIAEDLKNVYCKKLTEKLKSTLASTDPSFKEISDLYDKLQSLSKELKGDLGELADIGTQLDNVYARLLEREVASVTGNPNATLEEIEKLQGRIKNFSNEDLRKAIQGQDVLSGMSAQKFLQESSDGIWTNLKTYLDSNGRTGVFEELENEVLNRLRMADVDPVYKSYVLSSDVIDELRRTGTTANIKGILDNSTIQRRIEFLSQMKKGMATEPGASTYNELFRYGRENTRNEWRDPNNSLLNVMVNLVDDKNIPISEIHTFITKNSDVLKTGQQVVHYYKNENLLDQVRALETMCGNDKVKPFNLANVPDDIKIGLANMPKQLRELVKGNAAKYLMQQDILIENLKVLNTYLNSGTEAARNATNALSNLKNHELTQLLGLSQKDGWFGNALELLSSNKIVTTNPAWNHLPWEPQNWPAFGKDITNIAKDSQMMQNTRVLLESDIPTFTTEQLTAASKLSDPSMLNKSFLEGIGVGSLTNENVTLVCMEADAKYLREQFAKDITSTQKDLLLTRFYAKYGRSIGGGISDGTILPQNLTRIAETLGTTVEALSRTASRAELIAGTTSRLVQHAQPAPQARATGESLERAVQNSNMGEIKSILERTGLQVSDVPFETLGLSGRLSEDDVAMVLASAINYSDDAGAIAYIELRNMGFSENSARQVRALVESKKIISDMSLYAVPTNRHLITGQRLSLMATLDGGLNIPMSQLKNMSEADLLTLSNQYLKRLEKVVGKPLDMLQENLYASIQDIVKIQESLPVSDVSSMRTLDNDYGITIRDGSGFQGYYHGVGLLAKADMSDVAIASMISALGSEKTTLSTSYIAPGHYDVAAKTGIIVDGDLIAAIPFDAQFYTRVTTGDINSFFFNNNTGTLNGLQTAYELRKYFHELGGYANMPEISNRFTVGAELTSVKSDNVLFNNGQKGKYNETLVYNPQVKALSFVANDVSEIPQELITLARQRHLDIVLIRK